MAWSGAAGLNYGSENYFAGSEYGKGLDEAKKLEAYKKLTGQDFNPMASKSLGFGRQYADYQQYQNLFEPVRAARGMGRSAPTGEYKLRVGHRQNAASQQAQADEMRSSLLSKAYDDAIRHNLFSQVESSKEDYDKHIAEVGWEGQPGVDKWVRRRNNLTGEEDWVIDRDREREGNFYRRNKDNIIRGAGGVAGGLVGTFLLPGIGTAYGAMLGASLAGTGRDIKKIRDARREVRDARRDWENQLAAQEGSYQPQGGNLFRNAGEGVVEWATKDVEKSKRRGTYERKAT